MRIRNNIPSLNTNNNLQKNKGKLVKSLEKLSSGYKINRSGDDAAGLAISEKMRGQIRGLNMAGKNIQDGVSLIQTAEGALNEIHTILQRGRELSVQAANDTNTEEDRNVLQLEIEALLKEVDNIANTTNFNNRSLLNLPSSQVSSLAANSLTNLSTHALIIHSSINYQNSYSIIEGLNDSLSISVGGNLMQIKVSENTYDDSTFMTELNNQLQATNILFTAKYSDDLSKVEIVSDDKTLTIDSISGNLAAAIIHPTSTVASTGGNYRVTGLPVLNPGITITENINDTLTFELDSTTYSIKLSAGNYDVYSPSFSDSNNNSPLLDEINNKLSAANSPITAGFIYLRDSPPLSGTSLTFTVNNSALNSVSTAHTIGNFSGNAKNTFFSNVLNGWSLEDASALQQFTATHTPASVTSAKAMTEPVQIITGQNDTLLFEINGVATSIKLSAGAYSNSQLIDEFNNQFAANNIDLIASINHINKLMLSMNNYQQGGYISNISGVAANSLFLDLGTVSFSITTNSGSTLTNPIASLPDNQLVIQIGANSKQHLLLELCDVRKETLNLHGLSVQSQAAADKSITLFDQGLNLVSHHRSKFGAYQNRLEHAYENTMSSAENLQYAESRIRDTDMAKEMMNYTKNNILLQASQTMLAQSNNRPEGILQLLQ